MLHDRKNASITIILLYGKGGTHKRREELEWNGLATSEIRCVVGRPAVLKESRYWKLNS